MERRKKGHGASEGQELRLVAVGDILLQQTKPQLAFRHVSSIFQEADIRFANLEAPLSEKINPSGVGTAFRSDPSAVLGLTAAGFDVLSFANNHSMNHGAEAFLDTLEILAKHKIKYIGGGEDRAAARRPVILRRKGTTVGFLAYAASDQLRRYAAHDNSPGIMLIRLSPLFAPPHTNQEDVTSMKEDIGALRGKVDILVVSCHWGVSQGGNHTIAPHQTALAHAAIDSGADLVLGHHPHALQGIEIYKRKIVAYSLGNFIFDGYSLPMPKETMILLLSFRKGRIARLSFFPVRIDDDGRPRLLPRRDATCRKIQKLMEDLSGTLGTRMTFDGAEGIITL